MMTIILGRTEAEAKAKYADYRRHIAPEGALALMSGWTGIDFSAYDLDQEVRHVQNDAGRTALDNVTRADPDRVWTVREVVEHVGIGGAGPVVVGTPEKVADDIEAWFEQTDVDGLNVAVCDLARRFRGYRRHAGAGADEARAVQGGLREGHAAGEAVRRGSCAADEAASGEPVSAACCGESGGVDPSSARSVATNRRNRSYPSAAQEWIASSSLLAMTSGWTASQFTELLTTTSISFAPGRLKADDSTDLNCEGSVTFVASSPSDFATPVKSTGGSMKSMPI